jgi:hypothetical protein
MIPLAASNKLLAIGIYLNFMMKLDPLMFFFALMLLQ